MIVSDSSPKFNTATNLQILIRVYVSDGRCHWNGNVLSVGRHRRRGLLSDRLSDLDGWKSGREVCFGISRG